LDDTLRDQLPEAVNKRMASPAVSQQTHEARFSDRHPAQRDNKTVLFYLEREDLFELNTSAIPRDAPEGISFSDTLLRCLGWPAPSLLINIALHMEDSAAASTPVQTFAALWEVIDQQDIPVFRVQTPQATSSVTVNTSASQPTPQQIHHHHRILALETMIDELSDNDAQIARLLFQLVRKGHSRSHEHIKDLEALFVPIRQRNAEEWDRAGQMKAIFDEVARDKSQLLKLEDLAHHLDEIHAEDVRAILHVVRRNLKGGRGFVGELNRLFDPVKQRNTEAWKRASQVKKIFDELDEMSQHPSVATTQSLHSDISIGTARARKRKWDG
jgi:hypothetical protein